MRRFCALADVNEVLLLFCRKQTAREAGGSSGKRTNSAALGLLWSIFKIRNARPAARMSIWTLKLDDEGRVGLVGDPALHYKEPASSLVNYPTINNSASTTTSNTTHTHTQYQSPPTQSINQYGRLRKLRMHLCQLQLCSGRLLLQRTSLSLITPSHKMPHTDTVNYRSKFLSLRT